MISGGETPEELETLMEDAYVLGDGKALARLFVAEGLLIAGSSQPAVRGRPAIARVAERIADTTVSSYVAQPRRILQSRDIALLLGDGVINVARRGSDRTWRFVISVRDRDLVPSSNSMALLPRWAGPRRPPHR